MALYGAGLLGLSLLVQHAVPIASMGIVGRVFGEEPGRAAPILILMFINVHHYFTDGVIWKISNPDVRRELFAHVQSPSGARPTAVSIPVGAADAARRSSRQTVTH